MSAPIPTVAIGIAVHAEPHRFRATLAAVRRTAPPGAEVVLIADRPDPATAGALASCTPLRTLTTTTSTGGAACFNLLLSATVADVCVLLESGCLPAPRWLHHLLAGLAAAPRHGLAGPSTNRSWNEQAAAPRCAATGAAVAAAGRSLEARHGAETRTLEPLFSLADFCYAVRREVWQEIGAADDGFGAGPCWEMEYNARADRAGWRGVWVPASFVWRAPFTTRRARDEQRLIDASRRRYQDRLCGLRLRGERAGYEPHCRGDACEHFAPRDLVRLRIEPAAPLPVPPPPPPPEPRVEGSERPLLSCIMPTRNRPEFAAQAVRYFLAQNYEPRELIVLDDAGGGLRGRLPADHRIRYEELPAGQSIGAKRNQGIALARGELIAQWDDDDWYAPERLRVQVEPILAGRADITALRADTFFDLERWEFWACTDALHRRLFVHDVHGGTLVFHRRVWNAHARYPNASLAEDAAFLTRAVRRGARLLRVDTNALFVYLRHGGNAWSFTCGRHVDPRGWRRVPEPPRLAPHRDFYLARSATPHRAPAPTGSLVSCLMPTADRPRLAARAIDYFLRQSYPNRELVVVDDGQAPVERLVPADPRIHYIRSHPGLTLGAKRNLACSHAAGALLAHWDDDDWMADDRLARQVAALERAGADACGLSVIRHFDPARRRAWEYRWPRRGRPWVGGNTLLYRRSAWEHHPFPDVTVGEDTRWIWSRDTGVHALREPGFFAALIHPGNTSPKATSGQHWHPIPLDTVRAELGADWAFYESLAPCGGYGPPRAAIQTDRSIEPPPRPARRGGQDPGTATGFFT